MAVLLTVLVIAVSAGSGIAAELRWHDRAGVLARKAMVGMLWALLPIITFFNLARAEVDVDEGIGLLLAYGAVAVAGITAWFISSRVLKLPRASVGAVVACAMVGNTGYLGYPLIVAILGSDELSTGVVYDIVVSVPVLLIGAFAVGAAFGTKAGDGPRERAIAFFTRNPMLYAAVAALLAPDALAPDSLVDASRVLVLVMLPLGFFAVGTMLAEEAEEGALGFPPPLSKGAATAVAGRMVLMPALLVAISAPLIDLPDAYLLLALMPVGINSLLVGHVYGLDMRIIAQALAWSTMVAVAGALASLAF